MKEQLVIKARSSTLPLVLRILLSSFAWKHLGSYLGPLQAHVVTHIPSKVIGKELLFTLWFFSHDSTLQKFLNKTQLSTECPCYSESLGSHTWSFSSINLQYSSVEHPRDRPLSCHDILPLQLETKFHLRNLFFCDFSIKTGIEEHYKLSFEVLAF